jgi:transposase
MPKAHQRYANRTPQNLILRAVRIGPNAAILVERMMRDRRSARLRPSTGRTVVPHPEQGYRSAMGVLSLARRYEPGRLEAACERALVINAISYSTVTAILKSGLDRATPAREPLAPSPPHANIRGRDYYR